jgi:hypothetical protein
MKPGVGVTAGASLIDGSRETAKPDFGGVLGASAICGAGSFFGFSTTLGISITFGASTTFAGSVFNGAKCSSTFTGICFSPRLSTIGAAVFIVAVVVVPLVFVSLGKF